MSGEAEQLDDDTRRMLAEIDRLAEARRPDEVQRVIAARLQEICGPYIDTDTAPPRSIVFVTNDPHSKIAAWAREAMGGRELGGKPLWVRYFRADRSAGLVVVLHSYVSPGEMELVVCGNRGMLGRRVLRGIGSWAFNTIGLLRVVVRFRTSDDRLKDLARRAGFLPEGIARGFFADGSDASVWAMTRDRCRWLPNEPSFALDLTPAITGSMH